MTGLPGYIEMTATCRLEELRVVSLRPQIFSE